jgi:nicotinate-nucleotide adenylyltransferase
VSPAPTTPLPIATLGPEAPGGGGVVVLFGGTFDPPHVGHVILPARVRDALEHAHGCPGRGWLVYVPAARSPHKAQGPAARDQDRAAMVALAISELPRAGVWTDEIDRAALDPARTEPSYTVETLGRARAWLDEHGLSGATLRLLIGADQAVSFHRWRDPRDILRLAKPAVMIRGAEREADVLADRIAASGFWSAQELAQWRGSIVPVGVIDVSATQVRAALRSGDDELARQCLPGPVLEYIRSRGLYSA